MTGRERILAAINHREPDRTPLDLGGAADSSMVIEAYDRFKGRFKVTGPTRIMSNIYRLAEMDEEVLSALDIDTRAIIPGGSLSRPDRALPGGRLKDMWGVERERPEGSFYYDVRTPPLAGDISINDIMGYDWPDPEDPGFIQGIRERAQWITANTDAAVVVAVPSAFVHVSQYLRGFKDWFMDLIRQPALLEALFDACLEINLRITERILTEVGDVVDVVVTGDDVGGQQSLQMSPDHYRKYFKPRQARYFERIHSLTPAKLLYHSCGSIDSILDDLIDIGVDIINPVQTTAGGMDPVELKRKYAGRLVFWGGIETQRVLPFGSPDEVRAMVEELIEALGRGGGFVLASCHNIQPDVPPDNILAVFEHARTYRPSWAG